MRRELLFNVPPGNERPYWLIPSEHLVGRVYAPLYHGYGYYMDARVFTPDSKQHIDEKLTRQTYGGLLDSAILHALSLLWGQRSALKLVGTSVLFAELESYFAVNVENSVSFGSSHLSATAQGYILAKWLQSKKRSMWQDLAMLYALALSGYMGYLWAQDGFAATGEIRKSLVHRVDHVAHIGGLLTGVLSAYFV